MNISQNLRKRINFQGEFDELLQDVCSAYKIGNFISFVPIEIGYEDFNLKLITSKGTFFVKIFSDKRDNTECLRLINVVKIALDNGVSHPKFLKHAEGYIYKNQYEQFNIRVAVFEFIEGKNFFEMKRNPNTVELKEIIKMAAAINKIDYVVAPLYDEWALVNFVAELELARKYLDKKQLKVLEQLKSDFEKIDLKSLPMSLVHGDLISTNIMKDKTNIYFVDFSVANYYPRIVELAVLMSDTMFDPTGKVTVEKYYKLLTVEYQNYLKLTEEEIEVLPLFIKLAHAMHVVRGERAIGQGDKSTVTKHLVDLGKKGLDATLKVWK